MIKDVDGRFDDYSISPVTRHISLHWCYEIVEHDVLQFIFCSYINELLFFNRQELLQKAKDNYYNGGGKEKSAEYYIGNKDVLKEDAKRKYRNLPEEEKQVKREYEKMDIEI